MSQEPTDAELADGQYQPYRIHPTGGEVQRLHPDAAEAPPSPPTPEQAAELQVGNQAFALAIISLGVGIPISAIAATQVEPSLLGLAVAWTGIVGVNLVHHLSRRRSR